MAGIFCLLDFGLANFDQHIGMHTSHWIEMCKKHSSEMHEKNIVEKLTNHSIKLATWIVAENYSPRKGFNL